MCKPRLSIIGSGRTQPRRVSAFTLLEIMLAVAVLVIITMAIYDFTDTTLGSARVSLDMANEDAAYGGMRRLIETQLAAVPVSETGTFLGVNIKNKGSIRRDMLQLVCPAGNALLTPDAKGFYQITLGVRELPRGSGKFFLGMQREPWTSDDDDDDDEDANGNPVNKTATNRAPKAHLASDWIPLMEGVTGLEIEYFDVRLNGWVDKWTDQGALPNLVRMRLSAHENQPPYEIVARVPGGGPRRVIAAPVAVPGALPPGGNPVLLPNGVPAVSGHLAPASPVGQSRIINPRQ